MKTASFDSPYYPYFRDQGGFSNFRGWDEIPYKIIMYLMDLPDAAGYVPKDDNNLPRCRLWKLLANDKENPLSGALPSPAEKRSMLFDPEHPDINTDALKEAHPKGYRLFAQNSIGQSQLDAETKIFCYIGRDTPVSSFDSRTSLVFDIWCNVNLDTNTRTPHYNRADSIEQAIKEALNGVNIFGVGTVQYDRKFHVDCGSEALWDRGTNVGRRLIMAVGWEDSLGAYPQFS